MRRRSLAAALLLTGLMVPAGSRADGTGITVQIEGVVVDSSGEPLAGASVYDLVSWNSTETAQDGSYSLAAFLVGCSSTLYCTAGEARLTATAPGFDYERRVVPATDIGKAQNFTLRWFLSGWVTPRSFTSVPQTLSVYGHMASPVETTCLTFVDGRSSTEIAMKPTNQFDYSGRRLWVGENSMEVGAETLPGVYPFEIRARDCFTFQDLGAFSGTYYYDQSPPSPRFTSPKEGTQYVFSQELGPSYDGLTHLSGMHTFTFAVTDDVGLRLAWLSVYMQDGSYEDFVDGCYWEDLGGEQTADLSCEVFFDISRGVNRQYFARATVVDESGKYSAEEIIFYMTPV